MTYMISVTIADEFVRDCLEKEKTNKSSLITSLLHDYYKSRIAGYMKPEQIQDKRKELERKQENIQKEVSQLTKAEDDLLKISQEQDKQMEESSKKQEEVKESRLKSFSGMFEYFFEVTPTEAEELSKLFYEVKDKYDNLYEWGLMRGLITKESKKDPVN